MISLEDYRAQAEEREQKRQEYLERQQREQEALRVRQWLREQQLQQDGSEETATEFLAEMVGLEIGTLQRQVEELRDRVLKLEATNEVLRGFITSGNKAAPQLTSIKGKASDAA